MSYYVRYIYIFLAVTVGCSVEVTLTAVSQERDVQVVDDGRQPERVGDHAREETVTEQDV